MGLLKKSAFCGVLALGCLAFTETFANTIIITPVNAPQAFGPFVYVTGQVGWAHSDWSGFTGIDADDTGTAFGGKLGYQATHRFGAEIGGFALPDSDQNIYSISGTVKSWVAYGAFTFRMPLFKNERLYLRGKVGPAYRSLEHDGQLYQGVGNGHYWTGILGASLNYAFNTYTYPIVLGVEYSNIFGSRDSWAESYYLNNDAAPAAQIVAATLSVAFRV